MTKARPMWRRLATAAVMDLHTMTDCSASSVLRVLRRRLDNIGAPA
jgi:hypothetical protein